MAKGTKETGKIDLQRIESIARGRCVVEFWVAAGASFSAWELGLFVFDALEPGKIEEPH